MKYKILPAQPSINLLVINILLSGLNDENLLDECRYFIDERSKEIKREQDNR